MAIVGTAYVRLRVIGDKLKKDISDSVKKSVNEAAPDLKTAGESVGAEMSKGISEKITSSAESDMKKVGEDIGNALGDSMDKNLKRSVGTRIKDSFSKIWSDLKTVSSKGISDVGHVFSGFASIFKRAKADADDGGGALERSSIFSGFFSKAAASIESSTGRISKSFATLGEKMKKSSKDLGFSDFMVPLIAGLATVLPSLLSSAGAIIGSFVGWATTALASLGPALAGGALAGVAAMGTLKLSMGLLKLATTGTSDAVKNFKKQWLDFKEQAAKPIQEGLFSGFNAAMRISKPLLASLQPELRQFGYNVGDIAINFARMLSSAENTARIKSILATNNVAVKLAGSGITSLAQAFLILFQHLGPVITYLASGIQALGQWAATSLKAAEASGKLDAFITKTFNATKQFVGILVDFGKGLINVFHAAFGASGGMLTNLQGIAARFKEWTGSDAGQAKMLDFFTKARILTDQVLGILHKITAAMGHGLGNMDISGVSKGLSSLEAMGKPIADMFNAIKTASGGSGLTMLQNLSKVVTQLAQSGVIGGLAKSFSDFFLILSKILAIPGVGQILAVAGGLAVMHKTAKLLLGSLSGLSPVVLGIGKAFGGISTAMGFLKDVKSFEDLVTLTKMWAAETKLAAIATKIWSAAQAVMNGLMIAFDAIMDGNPVALIIMAIIAAVALLAFGIYELVKHWDTVWKAIKTAAEVVVKALVIAFHAVVDALKTAWNWIVKVAGDIWSAIKSAFDKAASVVSTVAHTIWDVIKTVFTAIFDFYKTIWTAIFNVVKTVLTAIWDVFKFIFEAVKTVVETVLDIIYQIWIRIFPILLLPLRIFEGIVILVWQGLVAAITWAVNLISTVLTTVWNAIWGFLQPIIQAIWDFIVGAWNGIVSGVSTALSAVWNFIVSVWNAVWGFLQPIIHAIWNFIVSAWNAIVQGVSAALQWVWGIITSVWNSVHGFISGVMSGIGNAISSGWNWIVSAISGALNAAWGIVQSIWNKITGFVSSSLSFLKGLVSSAWDALGNIGGDILSGLKSAVNTVIDGINWVIGGINGAINLANKLPGADIPTIPKIPHLAKGGVVSPTAGGTLALIAEAGKSERVEPLDENGLSKRDHAILKLISDGGGGGGTDVRVFIGDTELTSIVRTVVDKKNKNLASSLATGRKG